MNMECNGSMCEQIKLSRFLIEDGDRKGGQNLGWSTEDRVAHIEDGEGGQNLRGSKHWIPELLR